MQDSSRKHEKREREKGKYQNRGGVKPWLYLLPTIVLITFWLVKPLIQTLMYTFCDWNMLPGTTPEFVGLQNFYDLFRTPEFGVAIKNTFYYILMMIPFAVIIPLLIAAMIQNLSVKSEC